MKRTRLVATLGALLLATTIARAGGEPIMEEYWVEYPDEMWLVGEVVTDEDGGMAVRSMYISDGQKSTNATLYAVPFIDVQYGGLLDEASVTSWGGFALAKAFKIGDDRVLMTAEWYSTGTTPGGLDGGGSGTTPPDDPPGDDGGPTPPPVSNPFNPFISTLIYDELDQWASILNVYIADALLAIFELVETQPDDWTPGNGECIPPAPPGQPVFRTVTPVGTFEGRQWGNPTIPAENSITVFPVGEHGNCVTYQTLPDFPEPGPGPGDVRWLIDHFWIDFARPVIVDGGLGVGKGR